MSAPASTNMATGFASHILGLAPRAATNSSSSISKEGDAMYSNEQFLGLFNLILLVIIFFFFLASVPRAIARFRHPGAWQTGWILKQRKSYVRRATDAIRRSLHMPEYPSMPSRRPTIKEGLVNGAAAFATDDSDEGHENNPGKQVAPIRRISRKGPAIAPAHVPSWATLFHPFASTLGRPFFATGLSNGQALLYLLYTAFFITFAFVITYGTVSIARAGWLVIGNIPLMVALGAKNSIISVLVGSNYGKVNFIHRWIGKLMFIASVWHVFGYLVVWLTRGTIDDAAKHVSAWAAFAGLSIIAIASLPIIRRLTYNFFYHAHWIGYTVLLVAICFHVTEAIYWVLGALFIIGLDHVCRLLKSTIVSATITALPDLQCTRVEIPYLTRGWRAGQHVRIHALSFSKMGFFGSFMEVHPFTIASVSENGRGDGMVLYVKKTGDWTKKLYNAASVTQANTDTVYEEKVGYTVALEKGFGSGATMRMLVEGPYGGPEGHAVISSFSSAFVLVGGSGITYGLACVGELIRDTEALQARTRLIHLVWIVQDPAAVFPILPNLVSFLDRTNYMPTLSIQISIHYTRASASAFSPRSASLPKSRRLEVQPGRPNILDLLSGFVEKTNALARGRGGMSGVAVLSCGPKGLTEQVKKAARGLSADARSGVGGVEFIDE
ncbi:hypothetical protein FRB96_008878 [Tulasnella sp. 330]|nr:hypothetical protein FRB96_008878 [Tulasnella sp. 330]KAG8887828.1 hypothetical protein FRB98_008900 [Tulasnella sp. 332]